MAQPVGRDEIRPLSEIAQTDSDVQVRLAALDAASRFPLTKEAWVAVRDAAQTFEASVSPDSELRVAALRILVRVPLLSVRNRLRDIAGHGDDRAAQPLSAALARAGDASQIDHFLEEARSGNCQAFEMLAAMPIEHGGISAAEIPIPAADAGAEARMWHALTLARLGKFDAIDGFLAGHEEEPPLFYGPQGVPYGRIAAMQPVPAELERHLSDALSGVDQVEDPARARMARIIAWAATGIADAEGEPIVAPEPLAIETQRSPAQPRPEDISVAIVTARTLLGSLQSEADTTSLAFLPTTLVAAFVAELVRKANEAALALAPEVPANQALGNRLVGIIGNLPQTDAWPVGELWGAHLRAERPALDDGQIAWVIAQAPPARVIAEAEALLSHAPSSSERLRILGILADVADYQSGRGESAYRGASPGGGAVPIGHGPLIDDRDLVLMSTPIDSKPESSGAEPPPAPAAAPEPTDERRVNAMILCDGRRRETFLAGAENVIRCWIGVPEPERGTASDQPIPFVEIPPEGLPLVVDLVWKEQKDRKPLILPADRSARSGDCDLHIQVPKGERYVSAVVAFLYRGRVFEIVDVETFVLEPDEQEAPHHKLQVRVRAQRREVIELPDRAEFDATVYWGPDRSREADRTRGGAPALYVFARDGQYRLDLSDAGAAVKWLNEQLFSAEKSLVRRRERADLGNAPPVLDPDDPVALDILRNLARHGTELYNQVRRANVAGALAGERIQLLNEGLAEYSPVEFIYDRGFPTENAKLCDGWLEALQSDSADCPVCSWIEIPEDRRDRVETICPLGFWSLSKIIERLDIDDEQRGKTGRRLPAPSATRRALPPIETALFASSDLVPKEEREATWEAIRRAVDKPLLAADWVEWKERLKAHPSLLIACPHHGVENAMDYLELGGEQVPVAMRRLHRGQLTEIYVNPDHLDPGPIVLLLGCLTGARTDVGYTQLARRFQQLDASIVLGTLAEVLGRHAAPVAREITAQLVAVDDASADFGTIMRRVRRRMLAKGYLMALCLVALGDAEWRLSPSRARLAPA